MKPKAIVGAIFFTAVVLFPASHLRPAEGIISRFPDSTNSYCHLKFPAIREDTLFTGRPTLTDPREGDIIDFYGPCDYDPLGKDSIQRQQHEYRLRMQREYGRD